MYNTHDVYEDLSMIYALPALFVWLVLLMAAGKMFFALKVGEQTNIWVT
jgi:hypothetical protein